MDPREARDALDQIGEAKDVVSSHSKAPTGYYAALGLAIGIDVTTIAFPLPWNLVGVTITLLLVAAAVAWYRSAVGTWSWGTVNVFSAWPFWVLTVVVVVALIVSIMVRTVPVALVCGFVAFLVTAVLGPIWDRNYMQQVRDR